MVSPDGKYVAYCHDFELRVVELLSGKLLTRWIGPGYVSQDQWAPDGRELSIRAGADGRSKYRGALWIFELENKQGWKVFEQPPGGNSITRAFWSPDGARLAFDVRFGGGSWLRSGFAPGGAPWPEIWIAELDPEEVDYARSRLNVIAGDTKAYTEAG